MVVYKDNITRSVGLSYIFLGSYYAFGLASINKQTVAGVSISAFLFVLSDFVQSYSEKYSKVSNIYLGLQVLATLLNTAAIMFMLIFPFIDFDFTDVFFDIAGTSLTLASLGFTIFLTAKKNEEKNNRQLEESRKRIEEYERFAKDIQDVMIVYKKEMKELKEKMPTYEEIFNSKD